MERNNVLVGKSFCPYTVRARKLLDMSGISYSFVIDNSVFPCPSFFSNGSFVGTFEDLGHLSLVGSLNF